MGQRGLAFAMCGVIALQGAARSAPVSINNGLATAGHLDIEVDDYGAYGNLISLQNNDMFQPAGETLRNVSYTAGAFVFITTPDNKRSAVLLTEARNWINIVEPPANGDGMAGDHVLTRMVTTANASIAPNHARSAFVIQESATGPIKLDFALDQTITASATGGHLEQAYVISNTGTTAVALVFTAVWDEALIWGSSTYEDDVLGVGGTNRCYVFSHDPGSTTRAIAITDGGSTVPTTYYHAGKEGFDPPGGPVYTPEGLEIWTARGLPTSWRNHLSVIGYDAAGDTGASLGDNQFGLEWHVPIAVGASVTIKVQRHYGTIAPACVTPGGASCGNNVPDNGEACDSGGVETETCNANCTAARCGDGVVNAAAGESCETSVDTATCDSTTCAAPRCGDGHINAAAGETCDAAGDTADCNANNCQPPVCGDGYVNNVAGEQCEDDTGYCDLATCEYNFTIGGGCAGCGTGGDGTVPVALLVLAGFFLRRRRR